MRFTIFRLLVYLGVVFLGIGLFQTQVLKGDYYRKLSEQNRIRLIPLEAARGRVFDRRETLLATNRASYNVVATPEDVTPELFERLSKLLNLSEEEVRLRISAPREYPFAPALVEEDVSRELAFQIEERILELPGVAIQVSSLRYYPYGEIASHVIGYLGKVNRYEYEHFDRAKFGMNSLIGRAGIERIYDDHLRGWRGGRQIEVNAYGQMIRILQEKMPEPGEDLVLTLDLEFQKKLAELVEGKRAVIGVLDLETEGLSAMVSSPAYNPNVFVSPGQDRDRLGLLHDDESPMLARGVSSAYPPGSVFKLVTALAALETGKITPQTRSYCPGWFRLRSGGRKYRCWYEKGHGSLNLYEALERSCNVYFFNVGARLSPDEIAHYARELGLGRQLELEATNMTPGLVPDEAWKKLRYRKRWYKGETLSYAVGQSYLLISPIQMLRLVAIIAKGGMRVEPRLIFDDKPQVGRKKIAIRPENLKAIRRAMLRVVQSDYGTGQLARVDFTKLAAKTGTAQIPPKVAHSWMTGFFPYEEPELAFVVFVEHGGPGGITAARIVKSILEIWKDHVAHSA